MQVRDRIFPYPVLNNVSYISNYDHGTFELLYEEQDDKDRYILKKVRFDTNSNLIKKLYTENKISVVCVVECSSTIYRKCYAINDSGFDIEIQKSDVSEKVYISMYAYANENITYESDEFEDDYKGIKFEIEKYDIIAANDGYYYNVIHEETEDSFAHSIFSIIIDRDSNDGIYNVDYESSKKIVISLSENDYNNYKIIHSEPMYKEVFFNMLLVPTLTEALTKCYENVKNNNAIEDMEEVGNQFLWFRAILTGYRKMAGQDMTKELFLEKTPTYWAQVLLGKPLGISLNNLVIQLSNNQGRDLEHD